MKNLIILLFISIYPFEAFCQQSSMDNCELTIPNTITHDCLHGGRDYQFLIKSNCKPIEFSIKIYDRWGKEIYKSTEIDDFWDASKIEPGNYFWIIKVRYGYAEKIEKTGSVQFIK